MCFINTKRADRL